LGLAHSPRIVTDGLVIALDAGNTKSYPGSGTTWKNLAAANGPFGDATLKTDSVSIYSSSNGGYFSLPRAFLPNPGSSPFTTFTYSVWCQTPSVLSGWQSMIDQGNDDFLFAFFNNELRMFDPNEFVPTSSFTATADTWYNFVATHTHTGPISFYVDGELVHTSSSSYSTSRTFANWSFGAGSVTSGLNGNEEWDGDISSISIYNKALTAAEVQQNYNALKGRYIN